ncbi:unnamed protein product [Mytilus edulis]|uniref:Ig-like domain-containing protein n=1 Tax=Mytilus edulis TaxID=6550 RepID=A0A8S3UVB8_MYTED|nr:unnamed protein product [Mytilus edulis]
MIFISLMRDAHIPDTGLVVTQFPLGPLDTGGKVTLTCNTTGGNPLAELNWDCGEDGDIKNNTSGNTSSYSVRFEVNKSYNGKQCNCSATHPVTTCTQFSQITLTYHLQEEYSPPRIPIDLPVFKDTENDEFQTTVLFINHGAFGGVLKQAMETAQKWQVHTERQPLRFFDRELIPHLVYISRRLAKFVGCDPSDLVLVTNATTAINTVVKGTSNQQIVDIVRKSLKKGTKLAVFDHIPSNTPFILPIKELVDICREK